MVSGDLDGNGLDDLVVDFGSASGLRVWMNHATWRPLHALSPRHMVVGDLDNDGRDDVVADFAGVWTVCVEEQHELGPAPFAECESPGDREHRRHDRRGPDRGLRGGWALDAPEQRDLEPLHPFGVTAMVTVDLDNNGNAELVVSFPGHGVWIYWNNTSWVPLHSLEATSLAAGQLDGGTQADLVIDFGPGLGLWTYRNSAAWVPLHPSTAQGVVVADLDGDGRDEVTAGFGAAGLWVIQADRLDAAACRKGPGHSRRDGSISLLDGSAFCVPGSSSERIRIAPTDMPTDGHGEVHAG